MGEYDRIALSYVNIYWHSSCKGVPLYELCKFFLARLLQGVSLYELCIYFLARLLQGIPEPREARSFDNLFTSWVLTFNLCFEPF